MLSAMIRVGKSICEKFHKVPMHEKVYLFIDGAGGHGTNEAINKYDKCLMIDSIIKISSSSSNIICKCPRSWYLVWITSCC